MIEELAENLVTLKKEFVSICNGNSQTQEVIPVSKSKLFPIEQNDLELLHKFATKNPIYYNSYEKTIGDTACIVYEGDINKYWLNSIQHTSSCAPFSPTWIFSAYISSLLAKSLGYKQVIDIGSGDGRIAYCAKILGLNSYSIELDEMLVKLQNSISKSTGIIFNSNCSDATSFDYSSLNLTSPEFFIGGLAQMGGTALAVGVINNIQSNPELQKNTGMVFAGTFSQKYPSDPMAKSGWGTLIDKYDLKVTNTIVLPTAWTFNEIDDTPYIYAKFTEF